MNWYSMGANAPTCIDEARARARAVAAGDDYDLRMRREEQASQGMSRQGSIRAWRTAH